MGFGQEDTRVKKTSDCCNFTTSFYDKFHTIFGSQGRRIVWYYLVKISQGSHVRIFFLKFFCDISPCLSCWKKLVNRKGFLFQRNLHQFGVTCISFLKWKAFFCNLQLIREMNITTQSPLVSCKFDDDYYGVTRDFVHWRPSGSCWWSPVSCQRLSASHWRPMIS